MASGDWLLAGAVVALFALGAICWCAGGLASALSGHGLHEVPASQSLQLLLGVLAHPREVRLAWPVSIRADLPAEPFLEGALLLTAVISAGTALLLARLYRRAFARARRSPGPSSWADAEDLRRLIVARPGQDRLVLGRFGRHLLAGERGHSLLVVEPTQSGKTSGLAIPALLEWEGPLIATSVKTDLLSATLARRRSLGQVRIYDPTSISGEAPSGWSPLESSRTWSGARRLAAGLCGVARASSGGLEDGAFWYATAEKLLAPLLMAAALSGASMADVLRWVDTGEEHEVLAILRTAGALEAEQAAIASFGRDERQRSSVYTTAETVLGPFGDPGVLQSSLVHEIDPSLLVDGGKHSVFIVAPTHEQERLQPVFVALLKQLLDAAFLVSARRGRPLRPGLLVVLDEAANVAPLAGLDAIASTAYAHGIQLVTIWQDLAQLQARYGGKSATVLSNHRAKLLCSGISDPSTLEAVSGLIGEEERFVDSTTLSADGTRSSTWSRDRRRMAPVDWLRRIAPGTAVLIYGHLAPCLLELRPHFAERQLVALASSPVGAAQRVKLSVSAQRARGFGKERFGALVLRGDADDLDDAVELNVCRPTRYRRGRRHRRRSSDRGRFAPRRA